MSCIKTGCSVYIKCTDSWAYGDAFQLNGVVWFRFCEHSHKGPLRDVKHFTVKDYSVWHDEHSTSMKQNSTMICGQWSVTNHGHEGISI